MAVKYEVKSFEEGDWNRYSFGNSEWTQLSMESLNPFEN